MNANGWAHYIGKAATAAAVILVLFLAVSAYGKEVSGEIVGKNKQNISLSLGTDPDTGVEQEMLIPIDGNIKYNHTNGVDDLKVGDRIGVAYDEESEDFGQMKRLKKKVGTISFIGSAPRKAPDPDEEEARLLKEAAKGG